MPIGLLTGLGAALAWGCMDIASALASRVIGSLRVTAGVQLVGATILVVVAVVTSTGIPSDSSALAYSALLGLIGAGAYFAYFTALRIGPIAVVSGMVAAYGGLTVVLSVVLRGETLTLAPGSRGSRCHGRRDPDRYLVRRRLAEHSVRQPGRHLRGRGAHPLRDDGDHHGRRHRTRGLAAGPARVADRERDPWRAAGRGRDGHCDAASPGGRRGARDLTRSDVAAGPDRPCRGDDRPGRRARRPGSRVVRLRPRERPDVAGRAWRHRSDRPSRSSSRSPSSASG